MKSEREALKEKLAICKQMGLDVEREEQALLKCEGGIEEIVILLMIARSILVKLHQYEAMMN